MEDVRQEDEAVIERLDMLISLIRLAFREPLGETRAQLRADAVNAAILDACERKWVQSGELRRIVMKRTSAKGRTFNRRLADLVALGVITQRGATASREYASAGVV